MNNKLSFFNQQFDLSKWKKEFKLGEYLIEKSQMLSTNGFPNFVKSIQYCGTLEYHKGSCLPVYILTISHTETSSRTKITTVAHKILKEYGNENEDSIAPGLFFILFDNNKEQYRFSYVEAGRYIDNDNKVKRYKSNPKRHSFLLGKDIPVHTVSTIFKDKDVFSSIESIREAFNIEVVNRDFYREIQIYFKSIVQELVGQGYNEDEANNFAIRFLGRILFCWFLKVKGLIPGNVLFSKSVSMTKNYYRNVIEPLFFDVLNTPWGKRTVLSEYEQAIPFLNGGLFSAQQCDWKGEVTLGDDLLRSFFEVLERYNFTVDESTPTDVDIAIDPEMLGRIFENLLGELNSIDNKETNKKSDKRKETGSYYTPREVVDYMVIESLVLYLSKKVPSLTSQQLSSLFYVVDETIEQNISKEQKKNILEALHSLKILDPACGSGAFPMGILYRIFYLIDLLDPEHTVYKHIQLQSVPNAELRKELEALYDAKRFSYIYKKSILRDSIYGVDKESIAIEISRLRAFLSLIIECEPDKTKENLGVQPLPNLDFQFITANALGCLEATQQSNIFNQSYLQDIKPICLSYFNATTKEEKEEIKKRFEQLKEGYKHIDSLYRWNPFDTTPSDFFEPQYQLGQDNFDIVIGNPPYIQLQKKGCFTPSLLKAYQEQYSTYKQTGDIYQLFYERSLNLLNDNGIACLITSNKWMRADYGHTTRSLFVSRAYVYKLLDLGSGIFKSATVDTNIIFYSKKNGQEQVSIPAYKCSHVEELKGSSLVMDNQIYVDSQDSGSSFIIMNEIEHNILSKMKQHKPLKEWDIQVNRGVLTGCNEAFIINGEIKDKLIAEDTRSAEIIKPILRGRDIDRYTYKHNDTWLIATHNGVKSKGIPRVNIEEYPAVKRHLDKYIDVITKRDDQGDTPYNLRNCAYWEEFQKEKIVYPETSQLNKFAYDKGVFYLDKTCFMLITQRKSLLLFLLGVLSSNVLYILFYSFITNIHLGEKGTQFRKDAIEKLPIPIPDSSQETMIRQLVQTMLKKKGEGESTDKEEHQIDELVYTLYGLNEQEKEYIRRRKR